MKKLFRLILLLIAFVILLYAGCLWLFSNYNLGLLATTALGIILLLYSLLFDLFNRILHNPFGRVIKLMILLVVLSFTFIATLITVSGKTDTVTYQEDAVIVLGAGIHGENPSRILTYRLDAALKYHKLNPEAFIVVSGGQGPQEHITEALAMERYLLTHGIPQDKIIKEERATSTFENFLYSKQILDQHLAKGYTIAYITNSFHTFRAGRVATSAGLSATRLHASNDLITILPDYFRECCAIPVYWLCGK